MTGPPLRVFIVHGRDDEAKEDIVTWLKRRRNPTIEPVDFESSKMLGDVIPETFERVGADCDAAIVLATPDDLGRHAASAAELPRARQNVWLELGWFWARLGRRRTLLLIKGSVDIPSDLQGMIYAQYTDDIIEAAAGLRRFCRSLREVEADQFTEVLYVSADPLVRERQWAEVQSLAQKKLVITGISMGAVRRQLPALFDLMSDRHALHLEFLLVHPAYAARYTELFERMHRNGAVRDNRSFFFDLLASLEDQPEVAKRVSLVLHEGLPPFAVVVADGPDWGSTMIVQPFVPKPRRHEFNYPRLKLRRRVQDGVYMTYWRALEELRKQATVRILGLGDLRALVAELGSRH